MSDAAAHTCQSDQWSHDLQHSAADLRWCGPSTGSRNDAGRRSEGCGAGEEPDQKWSRPDPVRVARWRRARRAVAHGWNVAAPHVAPARCAYDVATTFAGAHDDPDARHRQRDTSHAPRGPGTDDQSAVFQGGRHRECVRTSVTRPGMSSRCAVGNSGLPPRGASARSTPRPSPAVSFVPSRLDSVSVVESTSDTQQGGCRLRRRASRSVTHVRISCRHLSRRSD